MGQTWASGSVNPQLHPTSCYADPFVCVSAFLNSQAPNGELNAEQLRYLGSIIAPYGEEGCGDITTRANIQLRGIHLQVRNSQKLFPTTL